MTFWRFLPGNTTLGHYRMCEKIKESRINTKSDQYNSNLELISDLKREKEETKQDGNEQVWDLQT